MKMNKHISLNLTEFDNNLIAELANEKMISITSYARAIILTSKEFQEYKNNKIKDHIRKFNDGKLGENISLRQSCIDAKLPYQSILLMYAKE